MKLNNRHKNVELIIDQKMIDKMAEIGLDHFPNEFGGFLIGNYSSDLKILYVNGFILPKKYKGFPTLFERYTEGLKETLEKLFTEQGQYYVGEWHTHPNGSSKYSQTDLNTMIEIENFETVYIENPILLIMGLRKNHLGEFTFYLYDQKKLIAYE